MSRPLPDMGLAQHSRLEPSVTFPNIHDFGPEQGPRRATWWLRAAETHTHRRNPLFSESSGVGIDSLAIDWLHMLSLGVFQQVCGHVVWALVKANAWQINGTQAVRLELSIINLRAEPWSSTTTRSSRAASIANVRPLCLP